MEKINIEQDIIIPLEVSENKIKTNTFTLQHYIVKKGKIADVFVSQKETETSNRAEMEALLLALGVDSGGTRKIIITNSAYVSDAINKGYLSSWKSNGWKNFSGTDVKNRDLWEKIDSSLSKAPHNIVAHKKSDKLVRELADRFNKQLKLKKQPSLALS